MKTRPNLLQLLLIVAILAIVFAIFFPVTSGRGHRPRPVKQEEMFGYWLSMPDANSAYRLFLTNGSGMLGVRDIYTDLWTVAYWQVSNRDISIDLAPVTHPEWNHEYIKGKAYLGAISGVHVGINQNGERYKRDIVFYREDRLRENWQAASAIMTNPSQTIEFSGATNRIQPVHSETNSVTNRENQNSR
jgi:hypothetical protein